MAIELQNYVISLMLWLHFIRNVSKKVTNIDIKLGENCGCDPAIGENGSVPSSTGAFLFLILTQHERGDIVSESPAALTLSTLCV